MSKKRRLQPIYGIIIFTIANIYRLILLTLLTFYYFDANLMQLMQVSAI